MTDVARIKVSTNNENDAVKKRARWRDRVSSINTVNCRFDIIRSTAANLGINESADNWDIIWSDMSVTVERCREMKRYQRINHFPGMSEICQKHMLARNLNRLYKAFPHEYKIFPRTWCLKSDMVKVAEYGRNHKDECFIVKPDFGCQGRGITITKNINQLCDYDEMICQLYIQRPFLIDGYKFDLRIYVLVTSCDPLRVFVYNEGLARFATAQYEKPNPNNFTNMYMHLTNYSVNKHSSSYVVDNVVGSKRKLSTINRWFVDNNYDTKKIWDRVDDVIIKTLFASLPTVRHYFRTAFPNNRNPHGCFEILGFDFLFDHKLKPYLLEVNHSPSFYTEMDIDREVKEPLLRDAFVILNLQNSNRVKVFNHILSHQKRAEWENGHLGNFRKIYPGKKDGHYEKFSSSCVKSLFSSTVSSKAKERDPITPNTESERRKAVKVKKSKSKKPKTLLPPLVSGKKNERLNNSRKESKSINLEKMLGLDLELNKIDEIEENDRIFLKEERDCLIAKHDIFDKVYDNLKAAGLLKMENDKMLQRNLAGNGSSAIENTSDDNKGVVTKLVECLTTKAGSIISEKAKSLFHKWAVGKNVIVRHNATADILDRRESLAESSDSNGNIINFSRESSNVIACEPCFIDEDEEFLRKSALEQREELMRVYGIHAKVYWSLKNAGVLKLQDQIKAILSKRWAASRSDTTLDKTRNSDLCLMKILERVQRKDGSKSLVNRVKPQPGESVAFNGDKPNAQLSNSGHQQSPLSVNTKSFFKGRGSSKGSEDWETPEDHSESIIKIHDSFLRNP